MGQLDPMLECRYIFVYGQFLKSETINSFDFIFYNPIKNVLNYIIIHKYIISHFLIVIL